MRIIHTSDWHLGHTLMDKTREDEMKAFFSFLLDTIKEKSGMDVTFFYGNKRIMTSIKDQSGERILGSPAGNKDAGNLD